ncbi:Dcun1d1 [Symbiodinium sp. KB8]|nr:Dcun1d1 [Symbiodinium sp. KB8]
MLRKHKWSVEAATNDWFTSGMKPAGAAGKGTVSGPKVAAMFAKYAGQPTVSAAAWRPVADASSGAIDADGIEKLCEDLGLDIYGSPEVLMLGYVMQADDLTDISNESFTRGMSALGTSTVEELKAEMPKLAARITGGSAEFAAFFKYAFNANKREGMRVLDGEVAVGLIRLLLGPRWALAEKFASFLESQEIKNVTKDTWMQTLAFSKAFPSSVESYDEDAAWPVVIDDFVASLKA